MDVGSEECGQSGSTLRECSGQTARESLRNQKGSYTTDITLNTNANDAPSIVNTNTSVIVLTTSDTIISFTTAGKNTTVSVVGNLLPVRGSQWY